jgi:4-amino-4-deoxy-L-arabinose transferase-like glycosyltransferase
MLILLGVMVVGLVLRLGGLSYGLPYLYHPDEPLGATVALNMLKTGDLNPHFFGYGSLFFYLNALAYIPYFLLGRLLNVFHSPADIPNLQMLALGVGQTFMPAQIVLGRLVSVGEGMACIPVAYWIGSRLSNRRVGLLAAGCVALSPTDVIHSQFITPNILTTLMVLLTLAAIIRLRPESRWPSYVWVGVALGSSIASKYNAAVLGLAFIAACFMLHGWRALRKREVYLSGLVSMITFFVVTPAALLDFAKFIQDTQFHLAYYATADHPGMQGGSTVVFYTTYLLKQEGLLPFLGLLPVLVYAKSRHRIGLILTAFALPYVLYISTLKIRNDRTILIALPVLFIMAADLLDRIWQKAAVPSVQKWKSFVRPALGLIVILSLVYLGGQALSADIKLATPDAREYARQWIDANLPTELRIIAETYTPYIDPQRFKVTYTDSLILNSPDWYIQKGYDVLVLSSGAFGRFYAMPDQYPAEVAQYDELLRRFPEIMRFDENNMTIRILRVTQP